MTLASDIITAAFRESNYVAVGVTPDGDEVTEALVLLQSLMGSMFALVVGTKLKQWFVPTPQKTHARAANFPADPGDAGVLSPNNVETPPANVRLTMKNTAAQTIYFQYQPQDGALMEYVDAGHTADVTLDANGQLFGLTGGDTTVVLTSDFPTNRNATRRWVYRADIASWVEITTLALADAMPFPVWFDDYFVTELAMRLSPRSGGEPRNITLQRNRDMRVFIRGEYEQMGIVITGSPGGDTSEQNHDLFQDGFQGGDAFASGSL